MVTFKRTDLILVVIKVIIKFQSDRKNFFNQSHRTGDVAQWESICLACIDLGFNPEHQ
jgi:hypothetical protein